MTVDLQRLESLSEQLVKAAKKAGADHCDVVVATGQSLRLAVRDGALEDTGRAESDDISLRVFIGRRVAAVSSNQASEIDGLAERAVAMAKVSPEDPYQGLADPDRLARSYPALDLVDPTHPNADSLREQALAAEAAGLAVKGVAKSMGASAGWSNSGFVLATSHGFSGHFMRSGFSLSAAMVSGEGEAMERDYDFTTAVFAADLESPEKIGSSAGERAVRRRNPVKPKSASLPILFDRRVAASLLGVALGATNAAAVARKTSFWRDRMNAQVAASAITIHDDPLLEKGLGSRPFDGEGLATGAMTLIENGVLGEWLLDSASARELRLSTNGRAARSGAGTTPAPTNSWIASGDKTPEALAAEIGTGLYLTETIGHGVNMVTGDYSKGASGFWIENGEIAYPVAEITVAGNLPDMFMRMIPANNLFFRYRSNAPSLLVEGMTIGGG